MGNQPYFASHLHRDETENTWRCASQYTDRQKYSTENQADTIREYAQRHGMQIVRTYTDSGKSGLSLEGRDALQLLIQDVNSGAADYSVILVLDVTRWGRFQDVDESAFYEYQCRGAGIDVRYVAEQFENDGSPVSTIVKGVKRPRLANIVESYPVRFSRVSADSSNSDFVRVVQPAMRRGMDKCSLLARCVAIIQAFSTSISATKRLWTRSTRPSGP